MLKETEEINVFTTDTGKEYIVMDIVVLEFDFDQARELGSRYFDVEVDQIQVDEVWVTSEDELYLEIPDKPARLMWGIYIKEESRKYNISYDDIFGESIEY